MHVRRIIMLLAVATLAGARNAPAQFPQSFDEFRNEASVDALRAQLDPTTNLRVTQIWWQLVRYSGRMYPVVPAQNYNIGQALPNGVVLLDLSTAGNAHPEVTAFFLGHEWAHQVLGHPRLSVEQQGEVMGAFGPTAVEDAADRWAARFVRTAGYDTAPIYEYLCSLPGGGAGDAHSSGPERAHIAQAVIGDRSDDVCTAPATTVDVRFEMWSRFEGSTASFDIALPDDGLGASLNNFGDGSNRYFDTSGLTLGRHVYVLSNIYVYDVYGNANGPFRCGGVAYVTRYTPRMLIGVRATPAGISCGMSSGQ